MGANTSRAQQTRRRAVAVRTLQEQARPAVGPQAPDPGHPGLLDRLGLLRGLGSRVHMGVQALDDQVIKMATALPRNVIIANRFFLRLWYLRRAWLHRRG